MLISIFIQPLGPILKHNISYTDGHLFYETDNPEDQIYLHSGVKLSQTWYTSY